MASSTAGMERLVGRRVAQRHACDTVVEIRRAGGEWVRAHLSDISGTGCRLARIPALPSGTSLWLRLPEFEPIAMRVRWGRADAMGCEFLLPADETLRTALEGLAKGTRANCPSAAMLAAELAAPVAANPEVMACPSL